VVLGDTKFALANAPPIMAEYWISCLRVRRSMSVLRRRGSHNSDGSLAFSSRLTGNTETLQFYCSSSRLTLT